MNTKIFTIGTLVLSLWWSPPAWPDTPWDFESPVAEYAWDLREEADLFSRNLKGRGVQEEELREDYRRWAEGRLDEIIEKWEVKMKDDSFQALPESLQTERITELDAEEQAYRRQCGQMTELFLSRYLVSEKPETPEVIEGGENSVSRQLEDLDRMLRVFNPDTGDPSRVAQWREAEESIIASRVDWEKMVEEEYTRELGRMKEEYHDLLLREERWEQEFLESYRTEREGWENLLLRFDLEAGNKLEELGSRLSMQREESLKLQQSLYGVMATAGTMLSGAREGIFLEEDMDYWKKVKGENLELYGETLSTMENLLNDLPGPVEAISQALGAEADLRLELAEQERGFLEGMIAYLSLPIDERPDEGELTKALEEGRDEYIAARETFGLCSIQAGAAHARYVKTALMLDLSEAEGSDLVPGLEADLETVLQDYVILESHRDQLTKDLPRLLESAAVDPELINFRVSLEEEEELRKIGIALGQAVEITGAKEMLLARQASDLGSEIEREIRELFPSGGIDAAAFAEGLQARDTEVLKDLAFALYHEKGTDLDPGYISSNQVYRKLKGKTGFTEDEGLGALAEKAWSTVQEDPELKELFGIYAGIIDASEAGTSVLLRGMTEDLGEALFAAAIRDAGKRIDSLKRERGILLGQASYYAGLATISYASLNVPGGIALSAISAGFLAAAADVKSDIDDISSLKSSLAAQEMSGAEERLFLSRGLDEVEELQERHTQIKQERAYFTTLKQNSGQWINALARNNGNLRGILGDGESGMDSGMIRRTFSLFTEVHQGTYTLLEFLDLLRGETTVRLEERQARNLAVFEEAEQKVRGAESTYGQAGEAELFEKTVKAAMIVELGSSRGYPENPESLGRTAVSLSLAAEIGIQSARTREELLAGGLEVTYDRWKSRKDYLYRRGTAAWDLAEVELKTSVSDWDHTFREQYLEDGRIWDRRLIRLQDYRNQGMRQLAEESARTLVEQGVHSLRLSPASFARRSTLVELNSLPRWSSPVVRVAETPGFRESLDLFAALDGAGENGGSAGLLPRLEESRLSLEAYGRTIANLYGRAEDMVADISFETGLMEMERIVGRHQEKLLSAVDRANKQASGSLHTTLEAAGYRKNGENFQRQALVDLTLFHHEKESQAVRGYRDFRMEAPNWDLQLNALISRGASATVNRDRYFELLKEIDAHRQLIFGEYEGDGTDPVEPVSERMRVLFEDARSNFKNGAGYDDHSELKGLLAWHIGYGPEMDGADPMKVRREGAGEAGRIMTVYLINEAKLHRGLSMMDTAAWDRRLWDDDENNDGKSDGLLRAATVRGLADLGMQAAASLFLSPGIGSALAGLGDDLFFAAADTAGGYASAGEAAFGLGKKAALQAAMAGNNRLWGGSRPLPVGWSEGRSLLEGIVPAAGRTAGTSLLNAGGAALNFEDGQINWSGESFTAGLTGRASQFGLLSSIGGTMGSNLLENSLFDRESLYGFSGEDIAGMRSSVRYGGELINTAAEYAYTGSTRFNLAGIGGTGLLELRIEDGGAQWAAGSGGTRISLGKINNLAEGLESFSLGRKIGRYAAEQFAPADRAVVEQMLRFQASFGDEQARGRLGQLLDGENRLIFMENAGYRGNTVREPSGALLTSLFSGTDGALMSPVSHALTLQHESYRDGLISGNNRNETLQAIRGHAGMGREILLDEQYGYNALQGDPQILMEMALLGGTGSREEILLGMYDSSGDYWKMVSGGDLMWDGSHHLWGEGGHLVASHERGSFSRDLADYLGIDRKEALELMKDAGLVYAPDLGTYVQTGGASAIPASPALAALYDMERRFRPGQEGLMPVSGSNAYAWASREHEYLLRSGGYSEMGYPGTGYSNAVEAALGSPYAFGGVTGLSDGNEFPGILETATLDHYSQQYLEEAVTGSALDASRGDGYCLAEALAFHYVDAVEGVNWDDLEDAFVAADWGNSFDPSTGYVSDKAVFTGRISDSLGMNEFAREFRFPSVKELNEFLYERPAETGGYHVVADYGGHFTHVRADGLEVNSYPGWSPPQEGPEEWRVYLWDSE